MIECVSVSFGVGVGRVLRAESRCQIEPAVTKTGCGKLLNVNRWELIVLQGDEPSVLQRLRELRHDGWSKGIIVLSTDPRASVAVACFEAGADDYIRSPFDHEELVSRVLAVARRSKTDMPERRAIHLDPHNHTAHIGMWRAQFKRTSFHLFAHLSRRPGAWVKSDELLSKVLRTHCSPGASNVRWHVLQTRRALGPLSWHLHGDPHFGYMYHTASCGRPHCHLRSALSGVVTGRTAGSSSRPDP